MAIILGCFVLVCETRLKLDKSLCRATNAEVEWSLTLLARKVFSHPRHGTSHKHHWQLYFLVLLRWKVASCTFSARSFPV